VVDIGPTFNDADAYERYMARWSRAVGAIFLDWIAAPAELRWLDIGCGTGVFTRLVLDTCKPTAVSGVDPAATQINYARMRRAERVDFHVADAVALPFLNEAFDIVASALVINFVPDRRRALAEMRRVCRPGGVVALYVWDFAAGRSPGWPLARGMRDAGIDAKPMPGAADSSIEGLKALFEQTG
jgi:ubiquinone/menaquinone biosynthesis C-methylase UbiE